MSTPLIHTGALVTVLWLAGCGHRAVPSSTEGAVSAAPSAPQDGGPAADAGLGPAPWSDGGKASPPGQGAPKGLWGCALCQGKARCVCTLAGDGVAGVVDGPAAQARFNRPLDVAVDAAGKVYVADTDNHRIRVISAGQVSTLAGTGAPGFADGPASSARFHTPAGVAVAPGGGVYVADSGNGRVRLVHGGQVTSLPHTFSKPHRVLGTTDGKLYVTDENGLHVIQGQKVQVHKTKYTHGGLAEGPGCQVFVGAGAQIMRLVQGALVLHAGTGKTGNQDGPLAQATFSAVRGLAADGAGRLYVADVYALREIHGGQVRTLGRFGKGLQDGPVASAQFYGVFGVATHGAGTLLVADRDNHRVRLVTAP